MCESEREGNVEQIPSAYTIPLSSLFCDYIELSYQDFIFFKYAWRVNE